MRVCFPYGIRFKQILEKLQASDRYIAISCKSNQINFNSMSSLRGLVNITLTKDLENPKNLINFNCPNPVNNLYFDIFEMCAILAKNKENYANNILLTYDPIKDQNRLLLEFISSTTGQKTMKDEYLNLIKQLSKRKYDWSDISKFDPTRCYKIYLPANVFSDIIKTFRGANTEEVLIKIDNSSNKIEFLSVNNKQEQIEQCQEIINKPNIHFTLWANHDDELVYEDEYPENVCDQEYLSKITLKSPTFKNSSGNENNNNNSDDGIIEQHHSMSQLICCEKPAPYVNRVTISIMPNLNIMQIRFKIDDYGYVEYYFGQNLIKSL
jgi:hypothetical protein